MEPTALSGPHACARQVSSSPEGGTEGPRRGVGTVDCAKVYEVTPKTEVHTRAVQTGEKDERVSVPENDRTGVEISGRSQRIYRTYSRTVDKARDTGAA